MLGRRTPATDRVSGPSIAMSDMSTRADAHKILALGAPNTPRSVADALSRHRSRSLALMEPQSRRAPRTSEHYDSVTATSTACAIDRRRHNMLWRKMYNVG
jgi:hypothetical protein